MRARAHGPDHRDVGHDQRRLARIAATTSPARDLNREEFSRFLDWVKGVSLTFDGSAYRTMLRNDAYWFTRLGTAIERADNTARILDVKYQILLPASEKVGGSLDYFQWTTILREVSAFTAYHWVYRESIKPWLVADLLILNRQMPRSFTNCYGVLVEHLDLIADAYGRPRPIGCGAMNRRDHHALIGMPEEILERSPGVFGTGLTQMTHHLDTDGQVRIIQQNVRVDQRTGPPLCQ